MRRGGRGVLALAVVAVALLAPAAASAHAYLIKTVPSASTEVDVSPPVVALTFDEAVEPRFAIISVSDKNAHQVTAGSVHRAAGNPDTLIVPLKPNLPEGWYLVYWRAISVDGHPVQGAFTFARGPNAGPAPQFVIPHISQTATTPKLLVTRWLVFLSVMIAIGLFFLRIGIARPVARRIEGTSLRSISVAFVISSVVGLIAIPVYLDCSTAVDSLRSAWDIGALVPLFRITAFGRGYVDMEICFALFCVAAWVTLWVDRPEREHRSIAELLAGIGALVAAAAVLVVPGASGHAAQTAPRSLSLLLDWLHLISGSIWLGGLIGLIVLWQSLPSGRRVGALSVVIPRFSNAAFVSVLVLLGTGTWATVLHMPLLSAMWTTSYGQAILVKIGLLLAAMLLAAVNLVRTKPRLVAARSRPELGASTTVLLRRLISGEALLITGAVFAAATLSSLAPPAAALAKEGSALAKVGPGPISTTVHKDGYTLKVVITPNKAVAPNSFAVQITKGGAPVSGANVTLTFLMLDMTMGQQEYQLKETKPGLYSHAAPALVMVGHWGLSFDITPKAGEPLTALVVDHAAG
ncbi:MAG TPA: copper resistance protein CopC [Gaiellaceae bacterium]|nr:copper resistance protein CopC [Gaiellaceae bacterium]